MAKVKVFQSQVKVMRPKILILKERSYEKVYIVIYESCITINSKDMAGLKFSLINTQDRQTKNYQPPDFLLRGHKEEVKTAEC